MSRYIDADALIEKCGEWYTEEGSEEGYIGTLKQLLDKQPTIEPKLLACLYLHLTVHYRKGGLL